MYSVELSNHAKKFLKKLPSRDGEIIVRKLHSIKYDPFPHLKKLKGDKFWRLRILKYRVILDILITGKRIIVLRIGHRKNVY